MRGLILSADHAGAQGTALIAAVLLMLLLSATGLGLALTANLEPAISRNFEAGAGALTAAESGIVLAAHELASVEDWSSVLRGTWRPASLPAPAAAGPLIVGAPRPTWAALTNLATCGQESPCSGGSRSAVTLERPWGRNNPSFFFLGTTRVGTHITTGSVGTFEVGVWVGDDPSEIDDDPLLDGGVSAADPSSRSPGAGILVLRAEAFGLRGEHAMLQAALVRSGGGLPLRLRHWSPGS